MSDVKLRLVIKNVRLSYAYLAEPQYNEDSDSYNYRTMVLIDKDHPQMPAIKKAIQQAAIKKFGAATAKKLVKNPKFHMPLRDPEVEDFEGDEYKGKMFFNAKTGAKPRPGVILKNGTKLTDPDEIAEQIYSGVWGHISVTFYGYDHPKGGKGVAVALNNFMKTKDDDHLDGSVDAADEFADEIDEDDDLGMMDEGTGSDDMDMDDDDDWGDL